MRAIPAALLLLTTLVAGCAEDEGTVTLDTITPGAWDVRGDTDRIMAWAHNGGDAQLPIAWSIKGADGAALPDGWAVTFAPPNAQLAADGTKTQTARGYAYPDWSFTMMTLTLPPGQAAGTFPLELHAGGATKAIEVVVHAQRTNVSGPGSQVEVQYEGRFHDSGELFDDGSFPTILGRGQTVPGFDNGLMGLAPGETATLVIPPAFGYGYDPPPSHAKFAGKTLDFKVTLTSLEG